MPRSRLHAKLMGYWESGWLPLLPYLIVYIFWRATGLPATGSWYSANSGFLLLHIIHAFLAAALLLQVRSSFTDDHKRSFCFWGVIFALLVICGPLLEFPADTWEHIHRIFEWGNNRAFAHHSYADNFCYLLSYSLIGKFPGHTAPISIVNSLYSWLLLYQCYRLARILGMGNITARIAVLVYLVICGNSIFSFFSYYGLSGAMLSQIATFAAFGLFARDVTRRWRTFVRWGPMGLWASRNVLIIGGLAATGLAYTSHKQGSVLIALGALAGVLWLATRLVGSCGRQLQLLGLAFVAGVVLMPAPWVIPDSTEVLLPHIQAGWLDARGAWAILQSHSPAQYRLWLILGGAGLANLLCGIWLILHGRLIGWFTCMPIFVLLVPFCGSAIALNLIDGNSPQRILLFHRVAFAVPVGFALVSVLESLCRSAFCRTYSWTTAQVLLSASLLLAVTLPTTTYSSRLFSLLASPNERLTLLDRLPLWQMLEQHASEGSTRVITDRPTSFLLRAFDKHETLLRRTDNPDRTTTQGMLIPEGMDFQPESGNALLRFRSEAPIPASQFAQLSGHWNPWAVALGAGDLANFTTAPSLFMSGWRRYTSASGELLIAPQERLRVGDGLEMAFIEPTRNPGGQLRFGGPDTGGRGLVVLPGPQTASRGTFEINLQLQPDFDGRETLFRAVTRSGITVLQLSHYRGGNRLYLYAGSTLSPPVPLDNEHGLHVLKLAWEPGQQILWLDEIPVLIMHQSLPEAPWTRIAVGWNGETLSECLHADVVKLRLELEQ